MFPYIEMEIFIKKKKKKKKKIIIKNNVFYFSFPEIFNFSVLGLSYFIQ